MIIFFSYTRAFQGWIQSLSLSLSAYRAGCWERILFSERKACFKCLLGWKRLHSLAVWCVLMPKHPASPCLSAVFHPLAADTLTHFSAVVLLSLPSPCLSGSFFSFFFCFFFWFCFIPLVLTASLPVAPLLFIIIFCRRLPWCFRHDCSGAVTICFFFFFSLSLFLPLKYII